MIFSAVDKLLCFGGSRIGFCRLVVAPYQEKICDMPEKEVSGEGFPELSKTEFIARFFADLEKDTELTVVKFEFQQVIQ